MRSRNGLRQRIHPNPLPGTWRLITLAEDCPQAFSDAVEEAKKVSFRLDEGPLFRCTLVMGQRAVLVLSFHHIISDGWSIEIVKRQLSEFYGGGTAHCDNTAQFRSFCEWQRSYLEKTADSDIAYWAAEWARVKGELRLPVRALAEAEPLHELAWTELEVDQNIARALAISAQAASVTPFTFLLAALGLFLSRYSDYGPVPICTYVNNRVRRNHYSVVGCCINTLMLSCDPSEASTFADLLAATGSKVLRALRHQQTPFEVIRSDLGGQGISPPRLDVLLDVQPDIRAEWPADWLIGNAVLRGYETGARTAEFPLSLVVRPDEHSMRLGFLYDSALFDCGVMERMGKQFLALLGAVVADPQTRLSELAGASEGERQWLSEVGGSGWRVPAGAPATLAVLIGEQVLRSGGATCLVGPDGEVSYAEVDCRANRLARVLRGRGAGRGVVVGVCLQRAVELVVALVAVTKVGGTFLPLDPSAPGQRLGFMMRDAGAAVLVTDAAGDLLLDDVDVPRVLVDGDADEISAEPGRGLDVVCGPQDLAYVVYTSGSTGRPKGVGVTHGNVVPVLLWCSSVLGPGRGDRVLHSLSPAFDFGLLEIFVSLASGAELHLMAAGPFDAVRYTAYIKQHGITAVHVTPSLIAGVLRTGADLRSLTLVHVGGEEFTTKLLDALEAATVAGCRIVNGYGPTENTVTSTSFVVDRAWDRRGAATVPIGRPAARTRVYVLSTSLQLVAPGVTGEVYVAGEGVARGYIGHPELTSERFLPDPVTEVAGQRCYRTGDLARWSPAGQLEFLGRQDDQVKVRGYRVELAEIARVLEEHPAIDQALVLMHEDQEGEQRIAAYVVTAHEIGRQPIRTAIAGRLPSYMIPEIFVRIPQIPLTANGKVDRAALPPPTAGPRETQQQPSSDIERQLVGLWEEILGIEGVGVQDDFFDLGGHSLTALRLAAAASIVLEVDVPLIAVFDHPTVEGIARYLEQSVSVLGE
jgi:amino acid adenylation domain-containing protein